MKAILLVVMGLGLAVVGCSNECDDAVDKAEECGLDSPDAEEQKELDECNESAECRAKCLNEASCDDIKAALAGTDNGLVKCALACPK